MISPTRAYEARVEPDSYQTPLFHPCLSSTLQSKTTTSKLRTLSAKLRSRDLLSNLVNWFIPSEWNQIPKNVFPFNNKPSKSVLSFSTHYFTIDGAKQPSIGMFNNDNFLNFTKYGQWSFEFKFKDDTLKTTADRLDNYYLINSTIKSRMSMNQVP